MKKTIISIGILLMACSNLLAQQESIINFYSNHLNLVNPAFVGVQNSASFQSTIRTQWTGINDAPETQAVSFMTPLGDSKMAMGVSFVHDKVFIEKQSFIAIDFSYDVKLSEKLNLFMGIKAGGNNYQVNTQGLDTYNIISDPSLQAISRFNPNIGVGFYLKHDTYYISLSVPKMLNTERAKNEDGFATVATDRAHFYMSAGYNFVLSPTLDLMPSVMVRYVNGAPVSTDFTATTVLDNIFNIGFTYRTDRSIVAMTSFEFAKHMTFGFAYEVSTRVQLAVAKNTNEIFLKYNF